VIVYVDTSALLKRVVVEGESAAVRSALAAAATSGDLLASSALTWVEVHRALRRAQVRDPAELADDALSGIDELPLRPAVLDRARTIGPPVLRSLDAIHLASAVLLEADQLLTFDDRLAAAAHGEGLAVLSPS
jgi:predicted nucleic acid-binding protein